MLREGVEAIGACLSITMVSTPRHMISLYESLAMSFRHRNVNSVKGEYHGGLLVEESSFLPRYIKRKTARLLSESFPTFISSLLITENEVHSYSFSHCPTGRRVDSSHRIGGEKESSPNL